MVARTHPAFNLCTRRRHKITSIAKFRRSSSWFIRKLALKHLKSPNTKWELSTRCQQANKSSSWAISPESTSSIRITCFNRIQSRPSTSMWKKLSTDNDRVHLINPSCKLSIWLWIQHSPIVKHGRKPVGSRSKRRSKFWVVVSCKVAGFSSNWITRSRTSHSQVSSTHPGSTCLYSNCETETTISIFKI